MANIKFTNFARTALAVGVGSGDVTMSVTGGTGALFPALTAGQYFYAVLENAALDREIVKVTARATDTFTVTRGRDGTTARSWVAGDSVSLRFVAAAISDAVVGTLLAANNLSDVGSAATARANLGALTAGDNIGAATATTQSPGDNSTKVATTAFVIANTPTVAGALLNVQVFTSTGTYTASIGVSRILVEALGPGAQGGTGSAAPPGLYGARGRGGQMGSRRKLFTTNIASQTVTIGASGGTTSFGSLLTAGQGTTGTGGFTDVAGPLAATSYGAGSSVDGAGAANTGAGGFGGDGGYGGDPFYGWGSYGPSAGSAGGTGLVIVYEYA